MKRLFVLIAGIALIYFDFTRLVVTVPWPKQVWLDLVVVLIVFVLNLSVFGMAWKDISKFRFRIPALGILWSIDTLYSLFSIGGLLLAHWQDWPFSLSVVVQLTLLFVSMVIVFLAFGASTNAAKVQRLESKSLASINRLRSTVAAATVAASTLEKTFPDVYQAIMRTGDDLRYLSASQTLTAHNLEVQMQSDLDGILSVFKLANDSNITSRVPDIMNFLDQLRDLIRLRKLCKERQDLEEMFT